MKQKKSTDSAISRRKFFDAAGTYTLHGIALGMLQNSQLNAQSAIPAEQAESLMPALSTVGAVYLIMAARYRACATRTAPTENQTALF